MRLAMTDPNHLEPKNGDFVAYLDRLQENSLEALRQANQESLTHPVSMPDSAQGDVDLKKIAAELRQRIEADRETQGLTLPQTPVDTPAINVPPVTPNEPQDHISVSESFRRDHHWGSRKGSSSISSTTTTTTPTPTPQRRRSNKSFMMFLGNSLMMFGVFLSIVFTNEEMDALIGPAIMMAIIGFIVTKIAATRH